ncbi:MAG: MlaD family protein [Sulfuricellaceae bacterium]|nr:MlaD family protein [Sulfuricellaceae bacterium]
MESKVNYTLVGTFVVVLLLALILGILWLSGGAQYRKHYMPYIVYMNESVSGLNLNAPVKYRGVEVGRVKRISLEHGERVRLDLDIEEGTPIKENTVAFLTVQGLTGIAQIELSGGSKDARPLISQAGEEPAIIKSRPSLLVRLDNAATDLLTSFNRTSDNINSVLDQDNRDSTKKILANIAQLTGALVANQNNIDAILRNSETTTGNAAKLTAELPALAERIARSADTLKKMSEEVSKASSSTRKTMDRAYNGIDRITDEALPELQGTLSELQELTASLKRIGGELERNPGMLVVGREPLPAGPGE